MPKRPTLTLIVPTHREDRPLARCLDSVRGQLKHGDEVLVVGDTHDGPLPRVEALVRSYGRRFRYLEHDAGGHDFGHSQLNYALGLAKGDYIHCQDDDDVWSPDALTVFRRLASAVEEPRPFLFRFRSYFGTVYWQQQGLFSRNHIGGHCLLAPNLPGKVGRYGPEYSGDFDWLASTVDHYGGPEAAIWRDEIVAIARPS